MKLINVFCCACLHNYYIIYVFKKALRPTDDELKESWSRIHATKPTDKKTTDNKDQASPTTVKSKLPNHKGIQHVGDHHLDEDVDIPLNDSFRGLHPSSSLVSITQSVGSGEERLFENSFQGFHSDDDHDDGVMMNESQDLEDMEEFDTVLEASYSTQYGGNNNDNNNNNNPSTMPYDASYNTDGGSGGGGGGVNSGSGVATTKKAKEVTKAAIQNLSSRIQSATKTVIYKVKETQVQVANKVNDYQGHMNDDEMNEWNENALMDSVIACSDDEDDGFF